MEFVDQKTLIHAGIEFVVIGGVTFWLNRRISNIHEEVIELRKKVDSYEHIIQQQNQLLSRHETMLRQIFGEQPKKSIPPPSYHKPPPAPSTAPASIEEIDEESEEEEEISPEELDKLLGPELKNIKQGRKSPKQEVECDGDECTLKEKPSKRKEHGE